MIKTARQLEIKTIKKANKASAVGRLMLGLINNWEEFFQCDQIEYEKIPRRILKGCKSDIKNRLSKEIDKFCKENFNNLTTETLTRLYDDIKGKRGIELPLTEFEKNYGGINAHVLKGNPKHLTISISLWGLQFKFPEDFLSKDLICGIEIMSDYSVKLKDFEDKKHVELKTQKEAISKLIRMKEYSQRSIMLTAFNLLESYLNGIAWDFYNSNGDQNLSNKKIKEIKDTSSVSIRDKLYKYPSIISGIELTQDNMINDFLENIKPFRDSLVHPSPFSAPDKFGGYDKLKKFYDLNEVVVILTVWYLVQIIKKIQKHIGKVDIPEWLSGLESFLNEKYSIIITEYGQIGKEKSRPPMKIEEIAGETSANTPKP